MNQDGPFSQAMVGVYASVGMSLATLLTFIVKSYFEGKERKRVQESLLEEKQAALEEIKLRRQWEVEDRAHKAEQVKQAEQVKKAAIAAARNASEAKQSVEVSRNERSAQMEEIKAEVKASSAASAEALVAANGHNEKIANLTQLANQVLDHTKVTVTAEPMPPEKQVVPQHPT